VPCRLIRVHDPILQILHDSKLLKIHEKKTSRPDFPSDLSICGSWPLFQFLNLYTVGRTPWTGDQPVAKPQPTHRINAHRQTSMTRVGFEPTIPAFERANTVHSLGRAATVIGDFPSYIPNLTTTNVS
jgi:hypothetical protein